MKKIPLLSIHHLKIIGKAPLISKANLAIYPGETVAFLGENGVGKTTVALSIVGLLNKKQWAIHGQVDLNGRNILDLGHDQWAKIRGKEVGFVFQDPLRSFNPLKTIQSHFLESIAFHENLRKNQALSKARKFLEMVGLCPDTFLSVYPFQLSGGEAQRTAIALSLIHSPSLLILDEPTASLDQKASNEIMALLKKVQQEKNMAILLISHDPSIVERYADRFLTIDQTVIKEVSKPAAVLQEMRPAMSKVQGLPFLRLNDFGVSFPKKMVLSQANFTLRKQEIIGIFGDNGVGKTTFARALVGLMPFTGQVLWYEKDAQTLSKDQKRVYAKSIQMVFQNPLSSFNPKMTLSDSIMEGVKLHFPTLSEQERAAKIDSALREVFLDPVYGKRYPETLSGGEIQKAAIARALVVEPDLLILDEPTASLDQESVLGLSKLIKKLYQRKNISFLIISHQRSFLDSLCHEVFELKEGDFYKSSDFRIS